MKPYFTSCRYGRDAHRFFSYRILLFQIPNPPISLENWDFETGSRRGRSIFLQPDLCMCGGITEAKKIAALAQAYSTPVIPKVWGTGVGLAASLQYVASPPTGVGVMDGVIASGRLSYKPSLIAPI